MFQRGLRKPKRYIDTSIDTQFSDVWFLLALTLLGIGLATRNTFFTGAAFLLGGLVGFAWLWNWFSLSGLSYTRHFEERRAFLGEEVELRLTVYNRKPLPLTWLSIRDTFSAALPVNQRRVSLNQATNRGEFRSFWMPNGFQRLTRTFTIQCVERGFHRYGPTAVETGDGFGFFKRNATLAEEEYLIVYPRIYSVAEMGLPSKNPFGERRGAERLFEDPLRTIGVREWQAADDPRRIHWKATARHQEMLSRVYEPSRESQVLLFLNVATMARHWHGTIPELLERTISVAASLASLAAQERLPVGLVANGTLPGGDQPLRLLPGRSPAQLTRLLELLAAVTPFASDPIEVLLAKEAPRLPWGATLVVVTAIAHDELLATLLDLSRAGRRMVLFTLAQEPPRRHLPGIVIYHLPGLVADLLEAERVL
jgi:uncharacterized protein (DUF58 family)